MRRNSIPHHAIPTRPVSVDQTVASAAQQLGSCTTEHVLTHLGMPVTRANEMSIAKQLKQLGYTKTRMMIQRTRTYVFFPPMP